MTDARRLLLGVLILGMIGTGAELLLLGHTEEFAQWVPLSLLACGIIAALTCIRPQRGSVRALAGVMLCFVIAGGVGLILHYRGNVEFEREMYPNMAGFELVWEALRGATPALAPGAMILLGLMGLIYCYKHPALERR